VRNGSLTKLVRSCFASLYALWLLTLACFVAPWHVILTLYHSPFDNFIGHSYGSSLDCRCSPSFIYLPGLKAEVQKFRSEQPEVTQHSSRRSKIDFTSAQNLPSYGNPYLQRPSDRSNFGAAERKPQLQPYGSDSMHRGSRPIGQSRWG